MLTKVGPNLMISILAYVVKHIPLSDPRICMVKKHNKCCALGSIARKNLVESNNKSTHRQSGRAKNLKDVS